MDLSLATVDQMMTELKNRGLEFTLLISNERPVEPHPERSQYELHSSYSSPLHQSVHFLLGVLSILGTVMEDLAEEDDPKADVYNRWVGAGETLLNDIVRTGREWSEDETNGDEG